MEKTGISALKMLSDEHQCAVCRIYEQMGKPPAWPEWSRGSSHLLRALDPSGLWGGAFWQSCPWPQLIALTPWLPNFLFWTFCLLVYSLAFLLLSYFWSCPFTLIILPEQHSCFFDLAFVRTSFSREVHVVAVPGGRWILPAAAALHTSCPSPVRNAESHRQPKRWEPLPQTWIIWKAKGGFVSELDVAAAWRRDAQSLSHTETALDCPGKGQCCLRLLLPLSGNPPTAIQWLSWYI